MVSTQIHGGNIYVPHHIPVIIELELVSISSNIRFGQNVNFLSLVISDLMYAVDQSHSFFLPRQMGTQGPLSQKNPLC